MPTAWPAAPAVADVPAADPHWRAQELLLMSEVMWLIGRSLATEVVMREMLHLMSELLGLNRGRIVLCDDLDGGVGAWVGTRDDRTPAGKRRRHCGSALRPCPMLMYARSASSSACRGHRPA